MQTGARDRNRLPGLASAPGRLAIQAWSDSAQKMWIAILLLALWFAVPRLAGASSLTFPPLDQVLARFWEWLRDGELLTATWHSVSALLVGLGIGVLVACALASLAAVTRIGKSLLELLTSVFNPLPAIGLLPVALLWFGFGVTGLVAVIAFASVWPMAITLHSGFRSIPAPWLKIAASLDKKGARLFAEILLPAALPYFLSGLRIVWAFGWRTLIAGELVFGASGTQGGLGWMIYQSRYNLDTAGVFAGLLAVMAIGLVVERLAFSVLEDRTVRRWGMAK